jgi:disulfide bond formation protein DsbB
MNLRQLNWIGFVGCVGAMAFALYLQYGRGMEPCPLCILQRMAMIGLGVFFLLAALHDPGRLGQSLYSAGKLLAAGAGVIVAGRHVWLQSLPADQVPSCGPGYDYLMENFPLLDAFSVIFRGSGECAKVDFEMLGVSLPQWTLLGFLLLAALTIWIQIRVSRNRF